jgi:hypothetical protein
LGLPKAVTLMAAVRLEVTHSIDALLESLDMMIALGFIRNRTRVPGSFVFNVVLSRSFLLFPYFLQYQHFFIGCGIAVVWQQNREYYQYQIWLESAIAG